MHAWRRTVAAVDDNRDLRGAAREFCALFQGVYLRFHRRDGKRSGLSGASRAVLTHLSLTGPVTIGEAAQHLDRAQSVVSEIVSQLERHGLLERERDAEDRRRTLVWLTPEGATVLREDGEVLSTELLAGAMGAMSPTALAGLLDGARSLLAADIPTGKAEGRS